MTEAEATKYLNSEYPNCVSSVSVGEGGGFRVSILHKGWPIGGGIVADAGVPLDVAVERAETAFRNSCKKARGF